jgi:hypothetical protein
MGFLRRILGGNAGSQPGSEPRGDVAADVDAGGPALSPDEVEIVRDRELLREEAERLDDDLIQRQLRYADRSWTPPAQGGPRRADDESEADG